MRQGKQWKEPDSVLLPGSPRLHVSVDRRRGSASMPSIRIRLIHSVHSLQPSEEARPVSPSAHTNLRKQVHGSHGRFEVDINGSDCIREPEEINELDGHPFPRLIPALSQSSFRSCSLEVL